VDGACKDPPCSTINLSELLGQSDAEGSILCGFPTVTADQRRAVEGDVLQARMVTICENIASGGGTRILERCADLGVEPYPSIWAVPLVRGMEISTGAV
jgi:hypothetical protein